MNPDITSAEYAAADFKWRRERLAEVERRSLLHKKAVARRRKAKRGGKR